MLYISGLKLRTLFANIEEEFTETLVNLGDGGHEEWLVTIRILFII